MYYDLQVLSPGRSLQLADDPGDEAPVVVHHVRLLLLNLHQVVEGLRLGAEDLLIYLKERSCEGAGLGWTGIFTFCFSVPCAPVLILYFTFSLSLGLGLARQPPSRRVRASR